MAGSETDRHLEQDATQRIGSWRRGYSSAVEDGFNVYISHCHEQEPLLREHDTGVDVQENNLILKHASTPVNGIYSVFHLQNRHISFSAGHRCHLTSLQTISYFFLSQYSSALTILC